jgi:hypothetical protein
MEIDQMLMEVSSIDYLEDLRKEEDSEFMDLINIMTQIITKLESMELMGV